MTTVGTVSTKLVADASGMISGAAKATAAMKRLTERIERQAAVYGKSTEEARIYQQVQRGASQETVQAARAAQQRIEALRAEAEASKRAAAIVDQTRTAYEKYSVELLEIKALHDAGKISSDVYGRASEQLASRLGVATVKSEMAAMAARELQAAQQASTAAQQAANQVIEQTRSPMERHLRDVEQLRSLLRAGLIQQDQYNRAVIESAAANNTAAQGLDRLTRAKLAASRAGNVLYRSIRFVGRGLRNMLAQVATLVTGGGLLLMGREAFTAGDALGKLSDRANIGTEALGGLTFAAKLAGVANGGLGKSLEQYNKNLGDAINGTGRALPVFRAMGHDLNELAGLPLDQSFLRIAESIRQMSTAAERTAAARRIFGDQGAELLTLINSGEANIAAMIARFKALGGELSRVDAAKIEDANDAMTEFRFSVQFAAQSLVAELAPNIAAASRWMAAMLPEARRIVRGTVDWISANRDLIVGLGTAAVAAVTLVKVWGALNAVQLLSATPVQALTQSTVWLSRSLWAATVAQSRMTLAMATGRIVALAKAAGMWLLTAATTAYQVASSRATLAIARQVAGIGVVVGAFAALAVTIARARRENISYSESAWRTANAIVPFYRNTLNLLDAERERTKLSKELVRGQEKVAAAQQANDLKEAIRQQLQVVETLNQTIEVQKRLNDLENAGDLGAAAVDRLRRSADEAAEALRRMQAEQAKLSEADEELDASAKRWEDIVTAMQDQVDTYGMSSRAADIWRATQAGAADEVIAKMRELDAELGKLDMRQRLNEQIRGLNDELAGARFGEDTRKQMELKGLGADDQLIADYMAQLDRIRELTSNDPTTRWQAGLKDLNRAQLDGLITFDQYRQELERLRSDLLKGLDVPVADPVAAYKESLAKLQSVRSELTTDQFAQMQDRLRKELASTLGVEIPKDPMAEYTQSVDSLSKALAAGILTWEHYGEGVRSARNALESTARVQPPSEPARAALVDARGAKAQRDAFERQAGINQLRDDVPKKQLDVQKEMNESLERIARQTGQQLVINVVDI
jgi:hypothetical protein